MVTSLLFEVNDILLTGTSPLALANSIYYLRANARENYASFEIRPLSFIWESQPSPGSLSFLFVCLFVCFFYDTIDQRSYQESLPIISCTKNLIAGCAFTLSIGRKFAELKEPCLKQVS